MSRRAPDKRERIGLPPRGVIVQEGLFVQDTGVCEGAAGKIPAPREPGKAGRPPGSTNRDTEDMRRYLASLGYRPGQIALAEIGGGGSLDQLMARAVRMAQVLDCAPVKAFELILKAASELATYTGSKVTPPPAAPALPAGVVLIHATADQVAQLADAGMVFFGSQKSPENGEILDVTPRQSDSGQSDT